MTADAACPVPFDESLAALRLEGAALDPVVENVGAEQVPVPTRLPRWNVGQLLAHLTRGVTRITTYLLAPEPPDPQLDWLDYWRAVRDLDPETIAERSIAEARETGPDELAQRWRDGWREAATEAADSGAHRVLQPPFGPMRLDHYLTTRLVEVVVHGLDLRHALELEEVATPQGVAVVGAVLDALLGVPRPVDLERDDLAFVLAATGRAPHGDPDLPVLS